MTFKVVSDVPMPACNGRGRNVRFPFAEMAVGDSFFMPGAGRADQCSVMAGVRYWRGKLKLPQLAFTTRKEDGGIRVWRIA